MILRSGARQWGCVHRLWHFTRVERTAARQHQDLKGNQSRFRRESTNGHETWLRYDSMAGSV